MTTKSDVINETLVMCEQPPSTGPSDTSTWVKRVSTRYNASVKALLERHPWNFSTKRVQLQLLPDTPIGRSYAYNKPADCLRILRVNNNGSAENQNEPDYEDEGGAILTDLSPCYMIYVSSLWMTKEGAWPQVFADAVAKDLAAKCYGLFGKSATKKDELKKDASKALQVAKSWDAAQVPFQRQPAGRWVRARYGARYQHGDGTLGGEAASSPGSGADLDGGDFDGGSWTP